MHSSIRRCASLRGTTSIRSISPSSLSLNFVCGRSISMAPRRPRASQTPCTGRAARESTPGVTRHGRFRSATQKIANLAVGQPRFGAHHALKERRLGHFAGRTDLHFADHAKPINFRIQRTQTVGQHFRKHRHDPIREIDRGTAYDRFLIKRRTDADVVGNIGNSHQQSPAVLCFQQ